jgi:hypothetical protein
MFEGVFDGYDTCGPFSSLLLNDFVVTQLGFSAVKFR